MPGRVSGVQCDILQVRTRDDTAGNADDRPWRANKSFRELNIEQKAVTSSLPSGLDTQQG
jgi:hypothetical protein